MPDAGLGGERLTKTDEAQPAAPDPNEAPTRLPPALAALQVPAFRLLWLNALSFSLANGMRMVALAWLALDLTDSPSTVGLVLFAQGVPLALLSLPAGVWADRFDRRMLLAISQVITIAVTAALAALIYMDVVTTWWLLAFASATGAAMALGQPSRQALVPALVGRERLLNAIVLNNVVQNLSTVAGPALAGGLIAVAGSGATFLAQVVILSFGLPLLFAMRVPRVERTEARKSALRDLREGLAYVVATPLIRSLFFATACIGIFFVGIYQALLPVFARDVLDVGGLGFGMLLASLGVGMLIGSTIIAVKGDFARKGEVLLWSLLICSGVILVFAISTWYALSLLMMLGWGLCAAFFLNLTITLIQSHTPDRLMGRVMSVQALTLFGFGPIGTLGAGVLADAIGAPLTSSIGAVGVAVWITVFLVTQPDLRKAR